MKKVAISLVAAASAVCLAGIVALAANSLEYEGGAEMQFDKAIWSDATKIYEPPFVRQSMIDDVLNSKISTGMTRLEVLDILGAPTETPYFKDYDLVYWLGEEKGFVSVDSSWLAIKLDADGKVADLKLVTD